MSTRKSAKSTTSTNATKKHHGKKKLMAVMDIGSNATRMSVGGLDSRGVFVPYLFTRVPLPLGLESYAKDKIISPPVQKRLAAAMLGLSKIAEAMEVSQLAAIATAAIRDCRNRAAVVNGIRRNAGISTRVLSGTEEAAITGVFVARQFAGETVLNIDSGGGSTDCALICDDLLKANETFAIGTARAGCGTATEKRRMQNWIKKHCTDDAVLAASGGGARKLKKVCRDLTSFEIEEFLFLAAKMTVMERATKFDLTPDRARNIIPAAKICLLILQAAKTSNMKTVKGGLGEAMLTEMLRKEMGTR